MQAGTARRPHRSTRPHAQSGTPSPVGVLVGVLIVSTLAACSGDHSTADATSSRSAGSSVTLPTPEASTSTGAGPSASGTGSGFDVLANMPAAAKAHTNAGAQAFARYYVEAYGRLLMDPAKGQLTKLYLPQCTECQKSEAIVADCVDTGLRWDGLYYRTVTVNEPVHHGADVDASTTDELTITSVLTNSETTFREKGGQPTTKAKTKDLLAEFRLVRHDGQWRVADYRDSPFPPPRS